MSGIRRNVAFGPERKDFSILISRGSKVNTEGFLSRPGNDRFPEPAVDPLPACSGHDFARIPVYHRSPVRIQPSLTMDVPGDEFEREAERIADWVTRSPERPFRRTFACHGGGPACRGDRATGTSRPADTNAPWEASSFPAVHDALRTAGQPLDGITRAFMESRLGHDFSSVRVHTDSRDSESAQAVRARAYTVGPDIVFAGSQYAPRSAEGRRLLAHELTHVVQQMSAPVQAAGLFGSGLYLDFDRGSFSSGSAVPDTHPGREEGPAPERVSILHAGANRALQRTIITGSRQSVTNYEYRGGRQRASSNQQSSSYVRLSYDDVVGVLTCTFPMRWRFPPAWNTARRQGYIRQFEQVVRNVWNNRFLLEEVANGRPTGRRASVRIEFDHLTAPDFGNETEFVRWLVANPNAGQRWTMSVSPQDVRDEVNAPTVELDPLSTAIQTQRRADYQREIRDRSYTSGPGGTIVPPPYEHYHSRGLRITMEARESFQHSPAAHEFGHMLGLSDEYILSHPDFTRLVSRVGEQRAGEILRQRRRITNRIMNAGDRVDRDHYQSFAEWLSSLTRATWRVGPPVASAGAGMPAGSTSP